MNNSKETNIKNCTCYHFNDIIMIEDFDFGNTLLDGKSYKNVLVYHTSYQTLIGAKSLCIRSKKR